VFRVAILYGALGFLVVAAVVATSDGGFPDLRLWVPFTAAFALLAWNRVEVNDHLEVSASIMALFAGAVVFESGTAVAGGVAMAIAGALSPALLRKGHWAQIAVDLGCSVTSAAAGLVVFSFVASFGDAVWNVVAASLLGSATFVAVGYLLAGLAVTGMYGRETVREWSHPAGILLPIGAMGVLGALLGVGVVAVGSVMLPLIAVGFFVAHAALRSYADLREARESTIRSFVKALEAKDRYTRGHTERVARFSEMIGIRMGYSGTRLERLRWAALIHDVGKLAVPRGLIRKRARLTTDEYREMQLHVHYVDELLGDVDFLGPVVKIAANHHAHYDGKGYHGGGHAFGESPCEEACILAVADSFDAITSTRSYRVALTQPYAFAELRRHAGTQFDPGVVEAFIEGMEASGQRFGSDVERTEDEARQLAEEGLGATTETDRVHGPDYPFARSERGLFDG